MLSLLSNTLCLALGLLSSALGLALELLSLASSLTLQLLGLCGGVVGVSDIPSGCLGLGSSVLCKTSLALVS